MPIRQLPLDVVTKIAAGEVVERPASVVKELLENSLDAGSTRIDIEIEAGGSERIRIVDDGCGIPVEELALALAPHATSKLKNADDLFDIHTLGFRGEALASIAGISKFTLQSRTREASLGGEIHSDGGVVREPIPWSGSPGTRIDVRHLFFNVPARRKFLKSVASELGQICETVTRAALAHPNVHITLRHNDRNVYDLPACENIRDRVRLFFGKAIAEACFEIRTPEGPYRLTGLAADPKCDRGNNKLQYFFVNGRWFRDRSLNYAFADAYRNMIMVGRHPIGFLHLCVPPGEVDVNVHPTKSEVKFRESATVFSLIRQAVRERMLGADLIPKATMPAVPLLPPEMPPLPNLFRSPSPMPMSYGEDRGSKIVEAAPKVEAAPVVIPAGPAVQIHDSYLIQETPEGMLVIDQHALHERILFEQFRQRVRDNSLEVQRLLIPEPIELPAVQLAAVLDATKELATLGLEVSDFGGSTILLSSYPTLLSRRPAREILAGVIDYLVSKDKAPSPEVMLDHLLATMACKAAVKAGDKLTPDEIEHLLKLRGMAEESHHCPHGRPTTLLFSRQDLDRQFRRT